MEEAVRVGVIGGGLMGSGIAEVCARSGHDVVVHEIDASAAEAAMGRVDKSLARAVSDRIVAEVAKDLTKHPVPEIEKLLFG